MSSDHVYVIAEVGINHNGSYDNCLKLIDAAVDADCDAVKLQFFKARDLYPRSAGQLDWKDAENEYSYDIYRAAESFEMPETWIGRLVAYCESKNIELLASAFDLKGFDFLAGKGIKKIKLASYVITNIPLLEHCAKRGLPIYLSTGGARLGETEEAVNTVLSYNDRLTILHCSLQYPTALRDCNLGVIETLRLAFPGAAVGYSDHTMEISEAPVQAVYLGATVVEKHITLDKKMQGPDHFFALEPLELKRMVDDTRRAEQDRKSGCFEINRLIYGNTAKLTYSHEEYLRGFAYMWLYAGRDIKKGEKITAADISILRSGRKEHGLAPRFLKFFEEFTITAKDDIRREDPITWNSILA